MKRLAAAATAILALVAAPNVLAAPPTGHTGIALDARVELAWSPVAGASGYTVYRGASPTTITTRLTPAAGVTQTSFVDTTAVNATTYYYAVRAIEAGLESANSLVVQATPRARTCSTGNPVVVENCFPGSNSWPVVQPASVTLGGIEGFATALSVDKGQTVALKVNAAAGVRYRLEIYRTGYYGNTGARLVSTVLSVPANLQPACATQSTTGLFDCSNWSASATVTTSASWVSGIYLLRLVREDTGRDNHILLTVRDDSRTGALLYGTSNTTYHAYNDFGGKSLYDFNSSGGTTAAGTPRAVKVSFDRPYEQPRSGLRDWYTEIDHPLVSWLEQSGYDVVYQSNTDLERNAARVLGFDAYVSPAHDEYWSAAMRGALAAGRDAGVSLFFSGSNEVYWKVRFEASPSSGVLDRVLVCYKSTQSGGPDPSGIPTGTWRDPAGANQPENALTGVMYVGDNDSSYFPFVVGAAEGADSVFRYTGLDAQRPGTSTSIGSILVGWEWDARVANGFEPVGVETLASTPVTGQLVQNHGRDYAPGTATAHMVKYRAASGALVVTTGTNHWGYGLTRNSEGYGDPDLRIPQITTNVLAEMNAYPQTPAADVFVDDPTAPRPPAPTGLAAQPSGPDGIRLTWNPVAGVAGYNVYRTFVPRQGGEPLGARLNGLPMTGTSFTDVGLSASTTYYYVVTAAAGGTQSVPSNEAQASTEAAAGQAIRVNAGGPAYTSSTGTTFQADAFFAGGGTFATSASISGTADPALYQNERWGNFSYAIPAPNGTYDVRLHFAEIYYGNETPGGPGSRVFSVNVVDTPAPMDIANLDIYAEVGPRAALVKTVPNVVLSDGTLNLQFLYGAADDPAIDAIELVPRPAGPPTVTQRTPAPDATGVAVSSRPAATFSRAMDPATITPSSFTLEPPGGGPILATVAYDGATLTATLTPGAALNYSTTYTARLATTIEAADGTPLASGVSWSFTTVAPPDTTPPTVPGTLTATGATGSATLSWGAATDNVGVHHYNVHRSTSAGFTPSAANRVAQPSSTTYTDNGLAVGTYYYRVIAEDAATNLGPASNEASAAVTGDTTNPTVALTAPADGATVSGTVNMTASASDNVGVAGVQFRLDGANLGAEDTTAPYSVAWDTTAVLNGQHTLGAIARDAAGNTAPATTRTVTVNNAAGAGPVAAYGFEEPSGTSVTDASGTGNTGTISGATRITTGRFGSALSFDGVNDWVTVADSASLDLANAMTLEGWVYPTAALSDWRTALIKEQPGDLVYALYANTAAPGTANRPSGHVHSGGDQDTRGTSQIPINTWTHVAATWDGATLRLYVNGLQVSTRAVGGAMPNSSGALRFGGNAVWGEYLNGRLDEIRVYRRALTPAEIQTDMNTAVG